MKHISPGMKIFLVSLTLTLLLGAMAAFAQVHTLVCTSSQACIAWAPSSGWADGTPYPSGTIVTYYVYSQADNQPPVLRGTTTGLELKIVGLPPGPHWFFVRAMVATAESANSNTAPKTIRFPGPTDGSIEAPTNGGIENR